MSIFGINLQKRTNFEVSDTIATLLFSQSEDETKKHVLGFKQIHTGETHIAKNVGVKK